MSDNTNKGVIWAVLASGALVAGTILYVTGNISTAPISRMFESPQEKAVLASLARPNDWRVASLSASDETGMFCGRVVGISSATLFEERNFMGLLREGRSGRSQNDWRISYDTPPLECWEMYWEKFCEARGVEADDCVEYRTRLF